MHCSGSGKQLMYIGSCVSVNVVKVSCSYWLEQIFCDNSVHPIVNDAFCLLSWFFLCRYLLDFNFLNLTIVGLASFRSRAGKLVYKPQVQILGFFICCTICNTDHILVHIVIVSFDVTSSTSSQQKQHVVMVYRMFFRGPKTMSHLLCTLKPTKSLKTFSRKILSFFQPCSHRPDLRQWVTSLTYTFAVRNLKVNAKVQTWTIVQSQRNLTTNA